MELPSFASCDYASGSLKGKDMHTVQEGRSTSVPSSDEDRGQVREQLNRLLESHHFKNSRRYPPLLRFIVEETLAGRGEFLKERLLGVRVFDRPADYDTAVDPIVRVTIAEIRKRIAQYYHDEQHDAEIRIELLPGRYAPEFRVRSLTRVAVALPPSAAEVEELRAMGVPPTSARVAEPLHPGNRLFSQLFRRRWISLLIAGLMLATSVVAYMIGWLRPNSMDELWAPMLASQRSVLFCVPTDVGQKRNPLGEPQTSGPLAASGVNSSLEGPTFLDYEALGQNVVYSDMQATLHIANILTSHQRDYRTKPNVSTTLEDLRQGPAVLIGGLDNQWTMRSLNPLRFHFAGSDEDRYWIEDANNPGFKEWSLDLKRQYRTVTRDYAIVARLHNEQTGQPEMIVAGIGMSGTAAAGEFLSNPEGVRQLRRRVGSGFKDRDFEAVLSTDVVNGIAGAPRIVAVSVW